MNSLKSGLSRRTFLFSTAAAVASSVFHKADEPLHVSIVGFGRHARRFFDSVSSSALHIESVFDPDPVALRSASAILKKHQRFPPELVCASHPSLIASSYSPVLLCSPPDTWATLIPYLTAHGRPVLAHHSELFTPPYWPESLDLLSKHPANLLLVGIDPAFPLRLLSSFHRFARSRGAINSSYSLWHPTWSHDQLLAFHFDCVNAALPEDVFPAQDCHHWQFLPMAFQPGAVSVTSPLSGGASCSISAAGRGIAFGAKLEIAEHSSVTTSPPDYLIQFANFCRAPQSARNRTIERQSGLLKLVQASPPAAVEFM